MRGWTFQYIIEEVAKRLKQLELMKKRKTEQQVAGERLTLPVHQVYLCTGSLAEALRNMPKQLESNDLLVPEDFNQGGYDMLSLKKEDGDTWTVLALQLTISRQHDIKTRFMAGDQRPT